MYDVFRCLFKKELLAVEFDERYKKIMEEIENSDGFKKQFEKEYKKLIKLNDKSVKNYYELEKYLSQDSNKLHRRRKIINLINILLSIVIFILALSCQGFLLVGGIVFSVLFLGFNYVSNIVIEYIIDVKDKELSQIRNLQQT